MCIITCRILEHIYLHLQPSPIIPSNFLESAQLFHARRLAQSSIGLHKDHRSLRHFLYYFASLLRSQILVESALFLRLLIIPVARTFLIRAGSRSEEHTSELQSLMRITYAVFCLKKKKIIKRIHNIYTTQ